MKKKKKKDIFSILKSYWHLAEITVLYDVMLAMSTM